MSETICQQALEDYSSCCAALEAFGLATNLPALKLVLMQCQTQQVNGLAALLARIHSFQPESGWLAWQCAPKGRPALEVFAWDGDALQAMNQDHLLLEAELANADAGLHLQLVGMDVWCCTEVETRAKHAGHSAAHATTPAPSNPASPANTAATTAIAQAVMHVGKAVNLHYQVLWLPQAGAGLRASLSRLCQVQQGSSQNSAALLPGVAGGQA